MIEINLLPVELRQVEGTPPARLGAILGGIAIAGVLVAFVIKFYIVDIPAMKLEITNREAEIKNLEERKKSVEAVIAQIDTLKAKVKTLDNLIQSRVRFARLLDTLTNSMPKDGVWFRTFSIQPIGGGGGGLGGSGKRYQINLQGFTTAPSELDRRALLTELINNMEDRFRVQDVDPKTGISNFLGVKFDRPRLIGFTEVTSIPELPAETDPKILRVMKPKMSKVGLDFSMTLSFELPAPKEGL